MRVIIIDSRVWERARWHWTWWSPSSSWVNLREGNNRIVFSKLERIPYNSTPFSQSLVQLLNFEADWQKFLKEVSNTRVGYPLKDQASTCFRVERSDHWWSSFGNINLLSWNHIASSPARQFLLVHCLRLPKETYHFGRRLVIFWRLWFLWFKIYLTLSIR